MKKFIKGFLIAFVGICIMWSAMVIIDYNRSKNLKAPIFAVSINLDQYGAGYYNGIGYDVVAVSGTFNGDEHILYDMRFALFGRGKGGKKTLYDNYRHNLGLLGMDKESVINYLDALEFITPDVSGNQEIYTEYVNGNDVKAMNLIFYNDIVAGFEYEYHNLEAAYDFANFLRQDLEMTFGEKSTYPGVIQTDKDYFDNVNDISDLKKQYTYYEDWHAIFDYQKEENINKMLADKNCSRIDVRFELSVIDENKATVSARYVALP